MVWPMLLIKGALVSLLLPIWATAGVAAVAVASFTISVADDPAAEQRVDALGVGPEASPTVESTIAVIVLAGVVIHLIAAVATSRAVAAMAGSLGGLLGTVAAGLVAVFVAAAPNGARVDGLRVLAQPIAIVVVGALSVVLGFRAYLAHIGRWRYARNDSHHIDDWGSGWDDGGD